MASAARVRPALALEAFLRAATVLVNEHGYRGASVARIMASINAAVELHRWLPGAGPEAVNGLYVRPALEGVLCAPPRGGSGR